MGNREKEANTRSNMLKEKDIELLRLADKASNLDKLVTNIKYYTKADKDKEAVKLVLKSGQPIYTLEDLMNKYNYWGPSYYVKTNTFYFSKEIPMEVFMLFRRDSAMFEFSDFIIGDGDPDEDYRRLGKD